MPSDKLNLPGPKPSFPEEADSPIRVPLEPFVRFSGDLEKQLRRLIARWRHTAPPNVRRFGRQSR